MTVSERECRAMRLLARDGWSAGELRMTMLVSRAAVRRHVRGACGHDHHIYAYPEWDGRDNAEYAVDGPTAPNEMTLIRGGAD
ncbi:hypothetical protein [Haloarcula sp. JP-L23]|uniref:hypothetical protein n=1 Tax=Haloarcula sp. JP-L23 TaxID=2716717 RepID=UPI00140EB835|nr:hypothetical protein G9465_25000 [Haloarcula sp. JP-L23]